MSDEQKKLPVEYRVLLQPGRDTLSVQAFWGPKSYVDLAALPGNLGLEQAIRWQWFGVLARPMLYVMLWIHDNVVANYGWSIVLLMEFVRPVVIASFPVFRTSDP